jgi:hypothetical protein
MRSCLKCGEEICEHDICYCDDAWPCSKCFRMRELEAEAESEAAWQRNVIGPLCGFSEEQ